MVDNTIALRGQSLQVPNFLGMANTAAQTRNTLAQTDIDQSQEQRAQYTGEVQKSRDALAYINSPEQYLAWHESTYRNPVLGPMLSKMGVTQEQSRAKIMDELQRPGGLQRLIQQSAAGADKIADIMQSRLNQMDSDKKTAAANARRSQEMAQINNLFAPTAAPANNLAPAATATPVAPPRNTLATPPGSPTAIENLYAPALANANATAATPFSPSQGGGNAPDALIADINTLSAKIESLSSLARQGNKTAAEQMKLVGSELKRKQDQLKFTQEQQDRPYKVGADVVANTVTSDDGTVTQFNSRGDIISQTPGVGKTSAEFAKTSNMRKQLINDLDTAIKEVTAISSPGGLIEKSTGSGVGRAGDAIMAFFGKSTEGAEATASLQPIADLVLKMVPRFEGPQSDKDTQSYREASGQLANSAVPNDTRIKAAKTIARLMKARKNQFVSAEMAAQGIAAGGEKTVVRTGIYNGRKVVEYSDGSTAYAD